MLFTVVVSKEDNWYIAKCIENSVASQGKTVEEAIANLKEALELYFWNNKKFHVEILKSVV
jgi:predicted RNase H-like HicB family nuclease